MLTALNKFYPGKPWVILIALVGMIYGFLTAEFLPGIKPKLLVKEGDNVKTNSPVFFDKNNPLIMFTAPHGGKVKKINFGERRRLEAVEIEIDENAEEISFEPFKADALDKLQQEKIISILLSISIMTLA